MRSVFPAPLTLSVRSTTPPSFSYDDHYHQKLCTLGSRSSSNVSFFMLYHKEKHFFISSMLDLTRFNINYDTITIKLTIYRFVLKRTLLYLIRIFEIILCMHFFCSLSVNIFRAPSSLSERTSFKFKTCTTTRVVCGSGICS